MAGKPLQQLELPPGEQHAYTMPPLSGEVIYLTASKSVMRLLVTGKESANAFAVVGASGSEDAPIGFHYHREAHDCFLCLKGKVTLWAGDQARTLEPGDYCSVPPNTVHQFQILGDHTEFIGLIFPGGWEEFFRYIGEPYDGPLYPFHDERDANEVLLPKILKAQEYFDMVRVPTHPYVDPQPWSENGDDSLPGAFAPYFLKHDRGKCYLVGGLVNRPMTTRLESNGKFSIGRIEGSSAHKPGPLSSRWIKFPTTHHCFQVEEGAIDITLDGDVTGSARLTSGDVVYIPADTAFKFDFATRYAMLYAFSNSGGLIELLRDVGEEFADPIPPEKAEKWDESKLDSAALQEEHGYVLI